jgi:thymidylate synthase ThyX
MKTKRQIFVYDDIPPEDNAMLQALYSRDPRSVTVHLDKVKESGPGKFMAQFYVGYGHKSIGDCGSTTIFIEGLSMLAAKAVQDNPLYNGQEASTRYLDMANQPLVNPVGNKIGEQIQTTWIKTYAQVIRDLAPELKKRFPILEGQKPEVYEKAIKAKAFDIARSLLPAGATTLVSWHTNLRQAHDHLKVLEHHPLQEIRDIAAEVRIKLQEKYPSSFSHKSYEEQEKYFDLGATYTYFHNPKSPTFKVTSLLRANELKKYKELFKNRPQKTELPKWLRKCGDLRFEFPLDFGSYRDLQRQRSMTCPMPLLTTDLGFHEWYLEQFSPKIRKQVETVLKNQLKLIKSLKCDAATLQYYLPMGYKVACEVTAGLPSAVYVAELRSGVTVHQTLRLMAQKMGQWLQKNIPNLTMHHDMSKIEWDVKRGLQDITKK